MHQHSEKAYQFSKKSLEVSLLVYHNTVHDPVSYIRCMMICAARQSVYTTTFM